MTPRGRGQAAGLLLLIFGGAGACERAAPPAEWVEEGSHRWRPLAVEGVGAGRFAEISPRRSGIAAATSIPEDRRLANRTLVHGTGVALGDFDADGHVDVYLCLLDRPNVLYRNLGEWRFEDVTAAAGAALAGRMSRGAAFADADGDGDLDLFVSLHGEANALLRNVGGRFEEADAGFEGAFGSNTVALADVDGDGDLDVYFANYKTVQGDDLFSPAERNLEGHIRPVGDGFEVLPPFDAHYRVERVGGRVIRSELADPDEFYLNDGSGRFDRVDPTAGIFLEADGSPLVETPRAWGLVARFFDLDDDLDADLYVANDFGSPDGIWLNEGGRFRAASALQVRTVSASSMGVDFADVDADGDTDFVTTEMLALDGARRRRQVSGALVPRTPPGRSAARVPAARNALQLNRGDGTFAEVAQAAGIDASEWTWGAMFLDVDLDGFEDLLVTNGHAWDPLDGDTQEALRTGRVRVDWQRELGVFPPLRLRNLAFRNLAGRGFDEMGRRWRFGTDEDVSHGIAAADLDGDGDLDVVITRLDAPPLLLRNEAGGARVAVRLRGRPPNTGAVGARLVLEGGAVPRQTRQITAGGMYLSGSDPLAAFAMGGRDSATLRIAWPAGGRTTLRVAANVAYEIDEPDPGPGVSDGPSAAPRAVVPEAAWFEPVASGLRHAESEFDELARQPLLPLEISRLGPGIAWEDVDRDGDPDLVLPAGAGGRARLVRVEAGRLLPAAPLGPPSAGDQTTIVGLPERGGYALWAGVSNWEVATPDGLARIAPLVRLWPERGGVEAVPGGVDAVGPLAAADVDGDGDLDLFVGGRAVPGGYPRPASSRLLMGQGGRWVDDPDAAPGLARLGMVSAAVFSDIDVDGDPDLLLALEWGSIRIFENEGGHLRDATEGWGLAALPGRWNGLATGDLDGDGRPDLVASSWGINTGRRASVERPLGVFAADFDGNGLVDLIETERGASGEDIPLRDYPTLSSALPFIRRAVPSYAAFAGASVEDLIGAGRAGVLQARAVTLRHTAFLNRGSTFEPVPLPDEAQLAPAFGVVVADFDRDGAEDVFFAQNFLATPQGLSRHDAGRGAVLRGDGRGGFAVVDASRSGIAVYGDARGAAVADYDADGRWDLAVAQNGEEARVFRGAGGPPGLRVRLEGGPDNPDAIGAAVRVGYEDGAGPAREVQAGSGYWSRNGSVQVFGLRATPTSVRVRWPGGEMETHDVAPGATEVVLRAPRRGGE